MCAHDAFWQQRAYVCVYVSRQKVDAAVAVDVTFDERPNGMNILLRNIFNTHKQTKKSNIPHKLTRAKTQSQIP